MQSRQNLSLGGEAEATVSFPVVSGVGLEVVLAQFWSTEGSAEVSADVAFHGVSPSALSSASAPGEALSAASSTMHGCDMLSKMMVRPHTRACMHAL